MWDIQLKEIISGNYKTLARAISLIENEFEGYESLLKMLPTNNTPVLGITGPPGAGKSTLVDALIEVIVGANKKVGVICVDPSSPFNLGALLGDRIRMNEWYNNPQVYIRSLATRGSLGGLHPKIIEVAELMKVAGFDYIIIETVGVGQSEIEIAGLADITTVVLVPEAGDEIQTMKAGLMEIADLFVVNKGDRPDADLFIKNLKMILSPAINGNRKEVPVLKTVASEKKGIVEYFDAIEKLLSVADKNPRKIWLLAERAYFLIQKKRMHDISKDDLLNKIRQNGSNFNLYQFIAEYSHSHS
jgi:LAO/AO transport system kinase